MFNLSESFSNPTHIAGLKLNQNPIPYITQLKRRTTSGLMISAGYGGGTANMEYMSLTGMSMGLFASGNVIPNSQVVPSEKIAPNVGNLFEYASAIHPYTGGYYNRPAVYRKYSFNKFAYLGSQYKIIDQKRIGKSMYLSDQTAYANALAQINSRQGGQFLNLITMQNHMPYTADVYPDHDYQVSGSGFAPNMKASVQHFTQGISYTDTAVKAFISQIDKLDKPVIMVFYGDHLPGIYDLPASVEKYSTDYFIYANKYAREHGAKEVSEGHKFVSTNDFIPMALEEGNAKVDPYTALLTDVQHQLPTMWQALGVLGTNASGSQDKSESQSSQSGDAKVEALNFVTESGKVIDESKLSRAQKRLLHDYRLIQYDITSGHQYCLKDCFTKTVK